jgi:hypothetical protein
MGVTVKPQTIYLGAGIVRSAWRIYDDEVMVDYAFSELEAKLKVENLREQKEHRDGA